jgi:hypothetical protein
MEHIIKNWKNFINESSLSRVIRKIQDEQIPFVAISADRNEHSRKENDARYKQLKEITKSSGYPFIEAQGSWEEEERDEVTGKPTGNKIRVIEKSIIIWNEPRPDVPVSKDLFELGKELSQKYDQDAFIYAEKGQKTGKLYISAFKPDGTDAGYGSFDSIAQVPEDSTFWSRVRGASDKSQFVFKETVEVEAPESFAGAMAKASHNRGKKITFVRGRK